MPPLSKKYNGSKELYESGLSIREVGIRYGIDRRSMYEILRRRKTKFRTGASCPRKAKYDEAKALYETGFSLSQLAKYYKCDKANIWKVLQRRGVKFRPNIRRQNDNPMFRGGPTFEATAYPIVQAAIEKGILIPKPCESCGDDRPSKNGRRNVRAHHDNYNFPLQVRWLCQKCHYAWHKTNKAIPLKKS